MVGTSQVRAMDGAEWEAAAPGGVLAVDVGNTTTVVDGFFQFSVENAYKLKYLIPISELAFTMSITLFIPS